jgi:hypothetical protein
MDSTPFTAGQFFALLGAVILGPAFGLGLLLPVYLVVDRWWDRPMRRARTEWDAWQAAHPQAPEDGLGRRFRLKQALWLEEQPPHVQAHLLRERLAEARREAIVDAMLDAERQEGRDGR